MTTSPCSSGTGSTHVNTSTSSSQSSGGERPLRVAVTGSSGLVGAAVVDHFRKQGHEVTRLVRSFSEAGIGERVAVWHPHERTIEHAALEGLDLVVHLAGESIFGVWTDAKKRRIRESRVGGTGFLAETLAGLERPPGVLLTASGVNYYGDRPPGEPVDEASTRGRGFLARVVDAWEAAAAPAAEAGIRVANLRFGLVMSGEGGLLGTLKPLFRLGLGGPLGDGRQMVSWIALPDVPRAMSHVLTHPELAGPVNVTTPHPVTNAEFTRHLAAALERPAFFRLPSFAARLAPGEMADELILAGARVVPRKLQESGFEWRYPELGQALEALL